MIQLLSRNQNQVLICSEKRLEVRFVCVNTCSQGEARNNNAISWKKSRSCWHLRFSFILKAESEVWNVEIIKAHFKTQEAKAIVSLPLAPALCTDVLCWHDDKLAKEVVDAIPRKVVVRWSTPRPGWFKLNKDAALANDGSTVGLGLVIRDSKIEMALEYEITSFLVESDSAIVVNLVWSRSVILSKVGLYIEDIISNFDNVSFVDINFVPRTANSVAHGAIFTLQVSGNLVWMEDVPSSIASLVSEDAHFHL
ncbi:hypothetical protein JRO89_XS15G0102800 [Xanthoceras sorbifolium]|uniref:RNase H type-1 domain-containing protein n=1 Tax=Xanthoceras sorbifolium TaxID=99658 RepID=A0ABQ8H1L7_9ROSI|nr:hypothetical protein JRO89_XS15G0102800 [Xanthoceras sorbifolium]